MDHAAHTPQNIGLRESLSETFSQIGFMPHGHCYLWKPALVSLHVISDTLIGLAYVSISIILYILVRRINLPFNKMVLCFGVFIGACGLTHFMDVWNLWNADYWYSAWVKVITAIASVGTGIYLYQMRHAIVQVAEAAKLAEQRRLDLEVLTTDLEKRVEERTSELKENEEQMRQLINSIPQLAWVARPDGHIFWYNQRWYEYTGSTPEEMEGWGWTKVHHPEELDRVMKTWQGVIENGEAAVMEFPLLSAKGEYRWFLTQIVPLKNSQGQVTRWFGTNTDITEEKNIRLSLQTSVRERDEFISIASHEMKTPLTSMKMQIDMTKSSLIKNNFTIDPLRLQRTLEVTSRQIDRLNGLVEDMLDASKASINALSINKEMVNLNTLVKDVIKRLKTQLDLTKNTVHFEETEEVAGFMDPSRIEQVITNLLLNSSKYSAGTPINVTLEKKDGEAILKVADQGMGIPKDRQTSIFNRFERAISAKNISGLGLGLYISKEILKRHEGDIHVESQLGQGATFIVELPLKEF